MTNALSPVDCIAKKLRITAAEYGEKRLTGAVLIGPDIGLETVCGLTYIAAATLADYTLGNVDFKVTRFFDEVKPDMAYVDRQLEDGKEVEN